MTDDELLERYPDGKDETGNTVWVKAPPCQVISASGEDTEAAQFVERLLNTPGARVRAAREALEEYKRQLLYNLPPSEGMPDVRPLRRAYER